MLIIGSKYLSELVSLDMLHKDRLNIIKSPTRSGKSYFALTAIPESIPDAHYKVVYLIDTVNGKHKGVEIIEGHMIPDHVHLSVSIPPRMSMSSFMGYLKEKSALMMFDKHANLKYKFGNRHFWAEGYYVSTVGLNEATIKKYMQDQEKHDIALKKLSVRECEDPFKGDGK